MNGLNALASGLGNAKVKVTEYKPQLLMIGAGGFSVAALAHAIFNCEKGAELKRIKRAELEDSDDSPLLKRVKIEIAALPAYIPSIGMEIGSVMCLGLSGKTWDERNAALAAAYGLGQEALEQYKDKVIDKIGEKKAEELEDEIVQEMMEEAKPEPGGVLIPCMGDTLFFDCMSGRWFYSDIEKIRRCENLLNCSINNEEFATLNDWYELIELDPVKLGDDLGWNVKHSLLDIRMVAKALSIEGEYDKPGFALVYDVEPLFR